MPIQFQLGNHEHRLRDEICAKKLENIWMGKRFPECDLLMESLIIGVSDTRTSLAMLAYRPMKRSREDLHRDTAAAVRSSIHLRISPGSEFFVSMNVDFEGADGEVVDGDRRLSSGPLHCIQPSLAEPSLWPVWELRDILVALVS